MAKIAIADNCGLKFSEDILNHWVAKGHEVRYERGASEYLAQWADIYYVEWIDNNLNYLWKLYHGDTGVSRPDDWDNNKKPKIVCRMFDWDLWNAFVPFYEQNYIDFIDVAICIAPHMQKYILDKAPQYKGKLHLIRPGVNLEKFTLKTKETDGFQLGMVLGDMWVYKNNIGGLNLFQMLVERYPNEPWKLHVRGQHEPGQFNPVYWDHFLKSRELEDRVILYPSIPDMNTFYEEIDYIVHPGLKETFCYGVAEAMAKGIKPIINTFYGSEDIWDRKYRFYSYDEAINMIKKGTGNPQEYRKYIKDNYPNEKMFTEYDKLLNL